MKVEYKLLIQSYSDVNSVMLGGPKRCFLSGEKKRTFRQTVFMHYAALSFLDFKAQFGQSAESQSFSTLSVLS